ncbi:MULTISPECIES: DUF262 domain-containing protein [Microbacterium]|uniref:DUF262 domain-containing protein n=1 Tax=Microbacterium hominis TaxID=162426 RepID=A0A2K9DEY9_9MICO|nr:MULTISPECIES: DUF262 domain-containing protein [Microbacterium]AUG29499.1 DUF262 domain-containing protein [Microbacterium hominis]EPD84196.1 hypothetical protein HMPREF1529_02261 [Microbacterium sp. oral taxon 186 str. F0373]
MSTFDETKHPRGQAANSGQFAAKTNEPPAGTLDDRAARMAAAASLEVELSALRRSRVPSDEDKAREAELRSQIADAYARPSRQRKPISKLSLTPMNRTAQSFIPYDDREDKLELNPPYQRGSVWSLGQRRALIESILRGIPIGAVTINDRWATNGYTGTVGYACVDGKQRIETIRGFFADEFSVPADWFEDNEIADEDEDGEIRFSQLAERGRRRAENWAIPTIQAAVPTVAGEARLYGLLNSGGTAQTEENLRIAQGVAEGEL